MEKKARITLLYRDFKNLNEVSKMYAVAIKDSYNAEKKTIDVLVPELVEACESMMDDSIVDGGSCRWDRLLTIWDMIDGIKYGHNIEEYDDLLGECDEKTKSWIIKMIKIIRQYHRADDCLYDLEQMVKDLEYKNVGRHPIIDGDNKAPGMHNVIGYID